MEGKQLIGQWVEGGGLVPLANDLDDDLDIDIDAQVGVLRLVFVTQPGCFDGPRESGQPHAE